MPTQFESFVNSELPKRAVLIKDSDATGDPNASALTLVNSAPIGTNYYQDDVAPKVMWIKETASSTSWKRIGVPALDPTKVPVTDASGILNTDSEASVLLAGDALEDDGTGKLTIVPDEVTTTLGTAIDPDGANNTSTTDVTATGFAYATSDNGAGSEAIKAFDNASNNSWISLTSESLPQSVGQDFGVNNKKIINKIRLRGRYSNTNENGSPINVIIRMSQDFSTWENIIDVADVGVAPATPSAFGDWITFNNLTPYRYVEVQVISSDGGSFAAISEIEMVEAQTRPALALTEGYKDKIKGFESWVEDPDNLTTSLYSYESLALVQYQGVVFKNTSGAVISAGSGFPNSDYSWSVFYDSSVPGTVAVDFVVDATSDPEIGPNEIQDTTLALVGSPHANYDGASDGDIIIFNGTDWILDHSPNEGAQLISRENKSSYIYSFTEGWEISDSSSDRLKRIFTLASNVSAGNAVSVNASGEIFSPSSSSTVGALSTVTYLTGEDPFTALVINIPTNSVNVVIWREDGGDIKAVVVEDNSGSPDISGNPVATLATGIGMGQIAASYDTVENRLVVSYINDPANIADKEIFFVACSIVMPSAVITPGATVSTNDHTSTTGGREPILDMCYDPSSAAHVAVARRAAPNDVGAVAITLSGSVITVGASVGVSVINGIGDIKVHPHPSTSQIVIVGIHSQYGTFYTTGSVSGTVVSLDPTAIIPNMPTTSSTSNVLRHIGSVMNTVDDRLFVMVQEYFTPFDVYVIMGTIGAGSVAWSPVVKFATGISNHDNTRAEMAYSPDDNLVYGLYTRTGAGENIAIIGNVDTGLDTFEIIDSDMAFPTASTSYTEKLSFIYSPYIGSGALLAADSASPTGTLSSASNPTVAPLLTNELIGIVTVSAISGSTTSVELFHQVISGQTGLTVGSNYYLDTDGTSTIVVTDTLLGIAISATEILQPLRDGAPLFTQSERDKLSAIEPLSTADQSDSEIKTAYENNPDTNEFSDAEKLKLATVENMVYKDVTLPYSTVESDRGKTLKLSGTGLLTLSKGLTNGHTIATIVIDTSGSKTVNADQTATAGTLNTQGGPTGVRTLLLDQNSVNMFSHDTGNSYFGSGGFA